IRRPGKSNLRSFAASFRFGLSRGVVALAGMHLEPSPIPAGYDVDLSVVSVILQISRAIGDQVAAPDNIAKLVEALVKSAHISREERLSSSPLGQHLQYFVGIGNRITKLAQVSKALGA